MSKKQIPLLFLFLSIALNVIARIFPQLTESYVNYIFPLWVETYGRVTGAIPFSVGEWMLYLAVFLLFIWILWGLAVFIIKISKHNIELCKYCCYKKYTMFLWWTFGIVCVIMTLNCFMLYQVPTVTERFSMADHHSEEVSYGKEELATLRDYVVERANELSGQMERDEQGYIITEVDLEQTARQEMSRLCEQFPNLGGYYPKPKKFFASEFFSQQYIMGYYFPFSMEANYNDLIYVTNKPATICHELSHLKGFIREDEANFIGYLACVDSGEPLFQYSAYLSVIAYLDHDFYKSVGEEEYWRHPAISIQVKKDDVFLTKEAWAQVESVSPLDTDMVQQASYDFLETTLNLNGVEDGLDSYSRVVELLLWYYDGKL